MEIHLIDGMRGIVKLSVWEKLSIVVLILFVLQILLSFGAMLWVNLLAGVSLFLRLTPFTALLGIFSGMGGLLSKNNKISKLPLVTLVISFTFVFIFILSILYFLLFFFFDFTS